MAQFLSKKKLPTDHFDEKDFDKDVRNELLNLPSRKILKSTAVPTKKLPEVRQVSPVVCMVVDQDFDQVTTSTIRLKGYILYLQRLEMARIKM